jgi:hypothetical protein
MIIPQLTPQVLVEFRYISHPSELPTFALQSAYPLLQVILHIPFSHTGLVPFEVEHFTLLEQLVPQLFTEFKSTSHPLLHDPSQLPYPLLQSQTPSRQSEFCPQFVIFPQLVPQVDGLLRFTSQPSELPSPELQSAYPLLQVILHIPFSHTGLVPFEVEHFTLLEQLVPQLFTEFKSTSHPLLQSLSQLANPSLQPHLPLLQVEFCLQLIIFPQSVPQVDGSLKFVSHPSDIPSPALQSA